MLIQLALMAGGVWLFNAFRKAAKEEESRIECDPDYTEGISEEQLEEIISRAAQSIKRIKSHTFDPRSATAYFTVKSNSGITTWGFSVDFNNYGHIDGQYWLRTDNHDSAIPRAVADTIEEEIQKHIEQDRIKRLEGIDWLERFEDNRF